MPDINVPQAGEELLTIRQLAVQTGLPLSWLYGQTAKESIPFYRLGKHIRFKPSEVRAWLEERRRGPRA
jgi:excisionase family DNA binding protein